MKKGGLGGRVGVHLVGTNVSIIIPNWIVPLVRYSTMLILRNARRHPHSATSTSCHPSVVQTPTTSESVDFHAL